MIWLTALGLMAVAGFAGSRQGAVRAAFTALGLVVAAILAIPLAPLAKKLLEMAGMHGPIALEIAPPFAALATVLIAFKVAAFNVHQKFDFRASYQMEDDERYRWERFSSRLGGCVGIFNGLVYFVILMIPVYVLGYVTLQNASENDPAWVRFCNNLRQGMQVTRFDRVVAGFSPATAPFYDAADIIALVRENPHLYPRLGRYPAFLSMAERTEFVSLAEDKPLNDLLKARPGLSEVLAQPKIQSIIGNREITSQFVAFAQTNLSDLREFLTTGKSAVYDDEKIVGKWEVDVDASILAFRKKFPAVPVLEINRLKQVMNANVNGTVWVAALDKALYAHSPTRATPPGQQPQPGKTSKGTWKKQGSTYHFTFEEKKGEAKGTLESDDRMAVELGPELLVFYKQK